MTQHAFIWLLTAGAIPGIFVVRILQHFRREAGNEARLIEWAHDDDDMLPHTFQNLYSNLVVSHNHTKELAFQLTERNLFLSCLP